MNTPFVGFDWWGLTVTLCNTLITFLIVKKFLYKPVRAMMAAREQEVQDTYAAAEKAKAEAEAMRADYTERLSKAKEEASELVASATRRANARSEEILKQSQQQAAEMKKKAEQDIEQERRRAVSELRGEVASLSMLIAGKVVEREVSEKDHERLVEEFIDKVG